MIPFRALSAASAALILACSTAHGFLHPSSTSLHRRRTSRPSSMSSLSSAITDESKPKGFGKSTATKPGPEIDLSTKSLESIKAELLELLPRMTGEAEEFRRVEELVNVLEDRYMPAQTLDFLNLAMEGNWQLLFSTNLSGTPNPLKFRLRELLQAIDCRNLKGKITNSATWDLAEAAYGNFDCTGTFAVECSYTINQGARMILELNDHVLQLSPGSAVPSNVPSLVGLLHRSMPKEIFDPTDHAVDTTYLDADLRIARYTGPRLEGVRDIFIRQGSLVIHPEQQQ